MPASQRADVIQPIETYCTVTFQFLQSKNISKTKALFVFNEVCDLIDFNRHSVAALLGIMQSNTTDLPQILHSG